MTPANVVSMDFETKEAMEDFLEMYERDSPTLYPDAEMLLMIKTTETSCVGVSVYPNEDARNLAESRTSVKLKYYVKEKFRLSGDMIKSMYLQIKKKEWNEIKMCYEYNINNRIHFFQTMSFS